MEKLEEIELPSGAMLRVGVAKFSVARSLYQAVLEEAKSLELNDSTDIDVKFLKDIFCAGMSSKKIEAALWACMDVSLYNNLRIKEETFEPVDARQDYMQVCLEVGKANILPFVKDLYAKYGATLDKVAKSLA